MDKRVLRILGLLLALVVVFATGAAAGGGIVFAANKTLNAPDGVQAAAPLGQADPEPGVVIASVAADSPAAEAGVERGDILLEINGETLDSPQELMLYVFDLEPGQEITLEVLHGDDERSLTATLGDRDGAPYLGVTPCLGLPAEPGMMALRWMARPGALILEVVADSPAAEAGLEVGDLITAVDGQELDAENDLASVIADYAPDDSVTLEVVSPGQEARQVTVQLAEHPEEEGMAYLGVQFQTAPRFHHFEGEQMPFGGRHLELLPFEDHFLFQLPEGDFEGGAVVSRVAEDSPAQAAGLQPGDIISAVDGEALDNPQAVVDAVAEREPGDTLMLTVYRPEDDETLDIEVTLAEHPEDEGVAYLGVFMGRGFMNRGFDRQQGMPQLRGRGYRFKPPFDPDRLPLDPDFEVEPFRFQFEIPQEDCCGQEV